MAEEDAAVAAQIEVEVALLIEVAGVAVVLAEVGVVTAVEVVVVEVPIAVEAVTVVEVAVQVVGEAVTGVVGDPGVEVAAPRKITECVNTGHKYCSSKLKSVKLFQNERAKILDTFADL